MQHTRTDSKCLLEEECMTLHDYMTLASNCMTCAPLVTRVSTSHFHVDCRLCYLWILDTVALCRCMESDSHCAVHSPCMRWEMGQWGSNTGRSVIYFVVSTFIYHLYLIIYPLDSLSKSSLHWVFEWVLLVSELRLQTCRLANCLYNIHHHASISSLYMGKQ